MKLNDHILKIYKQTNEKERVRNMAYYATVKVDIREDSWYD